MGKCSNAFFSETTNMIKAKLYMNVHWMVLYKLYVFYSDMKFKMTATAGLSLTLDPMEKMFQNASSLKPLGQLKPNCPGLIIGRSSVFYADRKSKMAATTGHSINTEPYGENTEIYSSLKLLHWLNLNCASIIGRSFTNFVFYVDRNSKMTTTAGHSFYIGPIVFFYYQVNDTGSWEPLVHIQSRQDGLRHFRASIMDTDCNSRKVLMDTKVWSRQLVCSVILEAAMSIMDNNYV